VVSAGPRGTSSPAIPRPSCALLVQPPNGPGLLLWGEPTARRLGMATTTQLRRASSRWDTPGLAAQKDTLQQPYRSRGQLLLTKNLPLLYICPAAPPTCPGGTTSIQRPTFGYWSTYDQHTECPVGRGHRGGAGGRQRPSPRFSGPVTTAPAAAPRARPAAVLLLGRQTSTSSLATARRPSLRRFR